MQPYDFLVVGAGSSGAVLAARLSEDPSVRVLVIEAGESGDADPLVTTPGRWVSLLGSRHDWGYVTEPERGLRNRQLAFPRGKALGGSSAINAMVHIRGHRLCFDEWRASGNPGWGYDDLLPHFNRSRSLAISECVDPHASHHAFLRAAIEQGFRADPRHDFNAPEPDGVAGFVQKNILNGRRHSTATAFLVPAFARSNLVVASRTQVMRLLVEGRRVVGVECLREGRMETVRATRGVVLCAGAVDSPRILMLSGIGPADQVRAHGIDVVAHLPGVGSNLQDHMKLSVRWAGRTTLPGSTVTAGLFTSSQAPGERADLQYYVGRGLEQPDDVVTITVSLVRPESRGSIALRSADPLAPPVIRANYLQAQSDVEALVRGVRLARRLGEASAYDGLRTEEVEPGAGATSAADLEHFVRQKSDTIFHAAGTCRMGASTDPDSVVDAELRVHGVEGLRVADASIMPEIVNAPTHAACVMIGEKCATLLRWG